jgi:hypothetical protein
LPSPNCRAIYDAVFFDGEFMATCPNCSQVNRVAGVAMSKELTGLCTNCGQPLDDHLYGRLSFACPPKGR